MHHNKGVEFDPFLREAGSNAFTMNPTRWIELTGAIGIIFKVGREGGTYAQRDIAFKKALAIVQFLVANRFQVHSLTQNDRYPGRIDMNSVILPPLNESHRKLHLRFPPAFWKLYSVILVKKIVTSTNLL